MVRARKTKSKAPPFRISLYIHEYWFGKVSNHLLLHIQCNLKNKVTSGSRYTLYDNSVLNGLNTKVFQYELYLPRIYNILNLESLVFIIQLETQAQTEALGLGLDYAYLDDLRFKLTFFLDCRTFQLHNYTFKFSNRRFLNCWPGRQVTHRKQ